MKAIELSEATGTLSDYGKARRKDTLVLTRRGKPVAAVVPVEDVDDWEDLVVGSHPDFVALIERSRRLYKPGTGIPLEEMRRRYGLPRRAAAKRLRPAGRRSR